MINFSEFNLEYARQNQCNEISSLVNLTYRGEAGWTKENHIIQGHRTTGEEVASLLTVPDTNFFVIKQRQQLVSCIYVSKVKDSATIGFFSVHPNLQGKGLGKHVLKQAESFALTSLGTKRFEMFVVSQRPELIEFYERRGYVRTGRVEDYPVNSGTGVPRVNGLTIEYLEKICS